MALFHAFLNWKRRIYYAHHYIAVGGACMNVDMYTKKDKHEHCVCIEAQWHAWWIIQMRNSGIESVRRMKKMCV